MPSHLDGGRGSADLHGKLPYLPKFNDMQDAFMNKELLTAEKFSLKRIKLAPLLKPKGVRYPWMTLTCVRTRRFI